MDRSRPKEIPKLISFIEDAKLRDTVHDYLIWDQNTYEWETVTKLCVNQDLEEITKLFGSRLQFGTAGLRGQMGPGYSNMNELVVIQTTQGFVRYLEKVLGVESLKKGGVVIGFDGRHNSNKFAIAATKTFTCKGYPVRLFGLLCPTPFVPFAIQKFGCCAGIMVTASHNPKDDNGYKVYWENGAQITSPHDKGIQVEIEANLKPWNGSMDSSLVSNPLPDVMDSYFTELCVNSEYRAQNSFTDVNITYTPMHGVGQMYIVKAFAAAKLPQPFEVAEQKCPDPEFPTVKFPNPEEGKSALNLAMKTANETDSMYILANDPDADRLAVAQKLPSGEWKIFNGNELGAVLGWWCLERYINKFGRSDLANCYMISSTVSSKILQRIASVEGFNFEETLTGFKWMGNRAYDLMQVGKTVLFAFEEAIGFMCGTLVLDKDGIGAAVKMAELIIQLNQQGLTVNDKLNEIYQRYGYHVSLNSYFLCYKPDVISEMFHYVRNMDKNSNDSGSYPKQLLGKFSITRVRDLTTGYDSGEPDLKAKLPVSKSSHMITFTLENGLVVTLRTSGTEPKVKYYTELQASPEQKDWNEVKAHLKELVDGVVTEWIQPDRWKFGSVPGEDSKK